MSALLFIVIIDWVMWQTAGEQPRNISRILSSTAEDFDFADNLALVSYQHMQKKTSQCLCTASRPEDRPEDDRSHDTEVQHPAPVKLSQPSNNLEVHLPWQHCQTIVSRVKWLGNQSTLLTLVRHNSRVKHRHQKLPQQGQKRLQNDKRSEVIPEQEQNQIKTTPELCAFHAPYCTAQNVGG